MGNRKVIGIAFLVCAALFSWWRVGFAHGKGWDGNKAALGDTPRLFIGESRPWPVNGLLVPFTGTVAVARSEGPSPR